MEPPSYSNIDVAEPSYIERAHSAGKTPASRLAKSLRSNLFTRSRSCISLHVDNLFVFIHPVPARAGAEPPESKVTGCAVLSLASPRNIKDFSVSLVGITEIKFSNLSKEHSTVLWQEIRLPLPVTANGDVPPGSYPLSFSFSISGTVAPREELKHGTTRHRIVATANEGGKPGRTIETEQEIELCATCAYLDPQRELFLDLAIEDVSEALGPYRLQCNSTLFLVGGLLSIRFSLPSPPQNITIHNIQVALIQSYLLRSSKERDKRSGEFYTERPWPWTGRIAFIDAKRKPDAVRAVLCDGRLWNDIACTETDESGAELPEALARLKTGEEWRVTHLARLPIDNVLRPSTHENTETRIRVSHVLFFELKYSDSYGFKKTLQIKRPVHVNPCCCMMEAIILPTYKQCDPLSEELAQCRATLTCLCGSSLSYLKSVQDPTRDLDPLEESVVVPIKTDEERLASTPSATLYN